MKTKKRLLSILLSLVMVLGLMPGMSLTAYAATDTYTALKNNATVVTFNGYNWYIIEDNSSSATEGTVTLLAADNAFGKSAFSDSPNNAYSSSKIKTALDALTTTGAFKDVADAIQTVKVKGSDSDTEVDAKLYLLDTTTANGLHNTIKTYNFPDTDDGMGGWWLRSPGLLDYEAACVFGEYGRVREYGYDVDEQLGVRPALKLNLSSVIFSSDTNTFSLKPAHTHSFTYSASGATITATCGAAGCPDNYDTTPATLTIATEGGTYDGATAFGATVTGSIDGVETPAVSYYAANDEGTGKTGEALAGAPTDAGKYWAEITLSGVKTGADTTGDVTASVVYTVAQADPTANAPTGLTATYGQTLADVSLENKNPNGNTDGTWAWADDTAGVGDVGSNTFKANFTPTSDNYKTVSDVDVTVTVGTAANPLTYGEAGTQTVTKTFSTAAQTATLTAASDGQGEVTYEIISQKKASAIEEEVNDPSEAGFDPQEADVDSVEYFTLDGTTLTIAANTPVGSYTVVVRATAAGNNNYVSGAVDSTVAVTVNAANLNTDKPAEISLVYDQTSQKLVKGGTVSDGGRLMYALGKNATDVPPDEAWSEAIPEGTAVGTYYVWYKVVGDANHNGVDPACVVVTIAEPAKTEAVTETKIPMQTLILSMTAKGKKSMNMKWTAVAGATGYDVFMSKDDTDKQTFTPELVANVEGALSCRISKLSKKTAYKAFVAAYVTTSTGKTYIGISPMAHAYTGHKRGSYTNAKSVKLKSKAAVTLAVGGTSKIKAKVVKKIPSKKLIKYEKKLRYYTTNASVAVVYDNGVIMGLGSGQCIVYAIAPNGVYKAITVTVI